MTSIEHEPAHRLFSVTRDQRSQFEAEIELVPLDELELAVNPRRDVSAEGIDRPAAMLSRGQLVPAIGRRIAPPTGCCSTPASVGCARRGAPTS